MIFADPIPFQEAIDSRRAKRLLPTDLSSEQLAALPPELREWASFSAGVAKAEHLQEFDNLTARIAGGATPEDFARRAAGEGPLLSNLPQARAQIRGYLRSVGYKAKPGEEGTIKDLSSDVRINLKLRTDVALAQGSGQYTAGQTPATLDLIPCQELVRVSRRKVPRNWPAIWRKAGGKFYGGGRMIAAKDDPIWCRISRFGVPYPPFDFNSGMGLRGVRRKEAVALGVIPEDYQVTPQPRPLPQGQAGAAYFDAALIEAMHQAGYVLKDGVLTTANDGKNQWRDSLGRWTGGPLSERDNIARGTRAMRRALSWERDVPKAMFHPKLGRVDFRWGSPGKKSSLSTAFAGGYGVSHFAAKHGRADALRVPTVVAKGKLHPQGKGSDKAIIEHADMRVVLVRKQKGSRPAWVLTGFGKRGG